MARVTHVAHAQQRYEMIPVLDDNGQPKRVPKMRNGVQMTSKRGLVFMTLTVADKTKPLPNHTCGSCHNEIKVGDPYKHISPKSGPYGGRTLYRCAACPTWQVWEYSSSLSAQLAQVSHDFNSALDDAQSEDDVQAALDEAAETIEGIAQEKRDSSQNIEEGFGHPTSNSEELADIADQLEAWAEEIKSASIPELPEPEEEECGTCGGSGKQETAEEGEEDPDCDDCDGEGNITPDDPTDDQLDEWREECRSDLSIVDESPV